MKATYVTAVKELLESGHKPDKVLRNLLTVLKQKGHERLYRSILQTLQHELSHQAEKVTGRVVVTSEKAAMSQKDAIKKALASLSDNTEHQTIVDEHLVGGYIVEVGDRRIDNSYKTALLKLYRNIIN